MSESEEGWTKVSNKHQIKKNIIKRHKYYSYVFAASNNKLTHLAIVNYIDPILNTHDEYSIDLKTKQTFDIDCDLTCKFKASSDETFFIYVSKYSAVLPELNIGKWIGRDDIIHRKIDHEVISLLIPELIPKWRFLELPWILQNWYHNVRLTMILQDNNFIDQSDKSLLERPDPEEEP